MGNNHRGFAPFTEQDERDIRQAKQLLPELTADPEGRVPSLSDAEELEAQASLIRLYWRLVNEERLEIATGAADARRTHG